MDAAFSLAPLPLLASTYIGRMTLAHFRSYDDVSVNFSAAPVVLTGANGCGKTNFLEAVSLLVPGKGLRRADITDLQNRHATALWGVAATVMTPLGETRLGTGRDPDDAANDRRIVHIDGRIAKGQNALAEQLAMAWITPDMDRILAEGASARRKWLDRLAYSFDPAHQGRMTRYEKAMRERLRLLREGPREAGWLAALENDMAQTGVAIAATRLHLAEQLQNTIAVYAGEFPRGQLAVRGSAEDGLRTKPALLVEDDLRAALAGTRDDDAQSGMTHIGLHRSDLTVIHSAKNCPADLCSTGEQKSLVIAIMLAYVRLLKEHRGMTPLFLLDDIAAHLDDRRRRALYDEILSLGVQAWLTGTDASFFVSLLPHAQHIDVEGELAA